MLFCSETTEEDLHRIDHFLWQEEQARQTRDRNVLLSSDLLLHRQIADVALGSEPDPFAFFSLSHDETGYFLVGLGLLVADTSPEGVPTVQAVSVSGDCRFLIFDGDADGHYRDPIVAVEKDTRGSGGGSCGVLPISGLGLLLVPLLVLLKK